MPKKTFHDQTTIPDFSVEEKVVTSIPKSIGPYKIESLLNKGGMSLLYLALSPKTQKPLVIKVLSPKYLENTEVVDRFLKEAKIIGLTDHPNIIKLYDQGQWEKGLFIAMEFIQGISLKQFILQKSLSPKKALQIILQVAYALCHLHTHGVIHRDLKPENILICESGQIKVIDFGIAQLDQDIHKGRETQRKRIMGTPIYMSPEQKDNPKKVSYASDIYSLGIITYELFLGRLSHGVIHLTLLPKNLRTIIEKALKINPEERYQDIVDFISDISSYIKSYDEQEKFQPEEPEEIGENLFQSQSICQPKKFDSPQLEVGIKLQDGLFFTGLYYDFFKVGQKVYFVIAEPKKAGMDSIITTSILRGACRMLFSLGVDSLVDFTSKINDFIHQDGFKELFSFTVILFDHENDTASLIICESNPIYHLPFDKQKTTTFSSTDSFLGKEENLSFSETVDSWQPNDLMVFQSKGFNKKNKLLDVLIKNRQNSSKHIAEQVFENSERKNQHPLLTIIFKRVF